MIMQGLKERIEAANAARARHSEMKKERAHILDGGDKARLALNSAQERLHQAESKYQMAVIQSPGDKEEAARIELVEARKEVEQAQDRLKAFECKQGDLLSRLGERDFLRAQSEEERLHELAWNAIAEAELEHFPVEALGVMKRAWACSYRSGNFTQYLTRFLDKHSPSESERNTLRAKIGEEFGMRP